MGNESLLFSSLSARLISLKGRLEKATPFAPDHRVSKRSAISLRAEAPPLALSLLVALALGGCGAAGPELAGDLLIRNVHLVSMVDERVAPDAAVLVRDGRIAWVGAATESGRISAAETRDGGGGWLLPGLVDMHVHLRDESFPALFLLHGVTTVVNLDGTSEILALRERVRSGEELGPDIVTSGPTVDGDPGRSHFVRLGSPDQARDVAADQARAGYDLLKVYDLIQELPYAAAVEAAHAAGLPVFGHIPKALGLEGILGRHDVVAHAEEYFYTFFANRDDRSRLAEAARLTAEAGLAVIPNTAFIRTILDQAEDIDGFLARPEMRYVPAATLADWLPEANRYVGRPQEWIDRNRRMHPFLLELTGALHAAGVTLFAGSDAGANGGIPGVSLLAEIRELRRAGLSNHEALAAATRVPGKWLADRVRGVAPRGTIEVGRRADLLLLGADPLADLAALDARRAVVVAGRWHDEGWLRGVVEAAAPPTDALFAWYRQVKADLAARHLDALAARLAGCPSAEFGEAVVNGLGYGLWMRDGDLATAIALFELNTRAYPASGNVWDSLGEALAERGDRAAAVASYERSLAADPGNDNARQAIARLRAL